MNVLMAIVMCAAAAMPAAAQTSARPAAPAPSTPRMDISAGYSYLHEQGTGGLPANNYDKGWVAAVSCRVAGVRIVGEIGGSYLYDAYGDRESLYGFLGGVRVGLIKVSRFSGFAQALVGMERFSAPGFSERNLAFQPGAGIDLPLTRKIGLRVQGDYRLVPSTAEVTTFKEVRLTAGVVIGIR
jgi:hypothetical protein